MIKKIKKKEVKEVVTTTEELYCDFCGKKANRCDWERGIYEINDTEIRVEIYHTKGEQYPEGRWGTLTCVDLCPDCFQNILMPFIKEKSDRTDFDKKYSY